MIRFFEGQRTEKNSKQFKFSVLGLWEVAEAFAITEVVISKNLMDRQRRLFGFFPVRQALTKVPHWQEKLRLDLEGGLRGVGRGQRMTHVKVPTVSEHSDSISPMYLVKKAVDRFDTVRPYQIAANGITQELVSVDTRSTCDNEILPQFTCILVRLHRGLPF